jgi:serine/threonine protein kinase/Tol biopolymer transport system component
MQSRKWQEIDRLFNLAVALPPEKRKTFIRENCGGDEEIFVEVTTLVAADSYSEKVLGDSVFPLVAQLLDDDYLRLLKKSDFGPYKVKKLLGRGGIGTVFLAEDARLERPVALKILPSTIGDTQRLVLRFQQEAKAASAITHENVAHVYEFGSHESLYYLAMEYVEGKTLRELLNSKSVDLMCAVKIALQIAKALRAAHRAGITHRDIKPENIMVASVSGDSGDSGVKVLDFGLAKLSDKRRKTNDSASLLETIPGVIVGTTAYMSPEQARGKKVDERTDIWSLGVVLYEMLEGTRPFDGETPSDIKAAILREKPPPLGVGREIPLFQTIIDRALEKEVSARYQSADEIVSDLKIAQRQVYDYLNPGKSAAAMPKTDSPAAENNSPAKKNDLIFGSRLILGVALILVFAALFAAAALFWQKKSENGSAARSSLPVVVRESERVNIGGRVVRAAFSKDGRQIVYAAEELGRQGLFLRETSSENLPAAIKTLIAPAERRFVGVAFAPDGKYVYYGAANAGESSASLYRIALKGGAAAAAVGRPEKILSKIETAPGLSPDGRQVVFLRLSDDESHEMLIIAETDGGAERVLHTRRMPDFISHLAQPVWSPDGQYILSSTGTHNQNKIPESVPTVIRVADGAVTPVLTQPWAEIWQTDWLPDGSGFILTGRPDNSFENKQLWLVSYPNGELTRLTNDFNDYYGVSVARQSDGGGFQVATMILERTANLWTVAAAPADAKQQQQQQPPPSSRQLTEIGDNGYGAAWARDDTIFFGSTANDGNPDIWAFDRNGNNRQRLTASPFAEKYPSVAAGDDRFVFYISEQSGVKSLWRMNRADGADARLLAQGVSSQPFTVAPDGKFVYYHSYFDGRGALWRVAAEGDAPPEKLADGVLQFPAVSPDGKLIVTSSPSEDGKESRLVIREIENISRIVRVLTPAPTINLSPSAPTPLRWTPDGKSIAYVVTQKGVGNVWMQPIDGGEPKPLTKFTERRVYSFDWSPDGREIVCARGEQTRILTLLRLSDTGR